MKGTKLKIRKTKQQKGITLVALIITIVVLLILAVVAITAITNDGILGHAQNSTNKYNQAVTNEQTMLNRYEEYLNNLQGGEVPIDLEAYILGADKKGKNAAEIINSSTYMFIDDPTTDINESTEVITLNMGWGEVINAGNGLETEVYLYAKYNNIAYKITADCILNLSMEPQSATTKSVTKIYEPTGREGTLVKYDSNLDGTEEDWYILTDRDGKVEIVSTNLMGSTLSLGRNDTSVTVSTDLDGDGTVGNDGDKVIASYNNAITTINNYCKSVVTATDNKGVRSVGGTNNSSTPYSSTNFDSWFKGTESVAAGDIQYEEDLVKLSYHGIAASNGNYWLASHYVVEATDLVAFGVDCVYSGVYRGEFVWRVLSDGSIEYGNPAYGVRPVVINPSGI